MIELSIRCDVPFTLFICFHYTSLGSGINMIFPTPNPANVIQFDNIFDEHFLGSG